MRRIAGRPVGFECPAQRGDERTQCANGAGWRIGPQAARTEKPKITSNLVEPGVTLAIARTCTVPLPASGWGNRSLLFRVPAGSLVNFSPAPAPGDCREVRAVSGEVG
ncbi:hypothetical protein [Streptomyces broussonetiae]|uniref:Uncharacterized protein n=1 Tax=Streptomyces broussonetiae TaxID=2686304 RepID=A0A6I6MSH3_9ACTN|nr:hypothetical protein [Streptomyces broussonetiae]QHA02432.1 hypothetical protein GQF42_03205 [Streptomyces broussonetiae]